jgi:hypothetical protein
MTIWVDADACPKVIKEIICKAADRGKIATVFIANQPIPLPPSSFIRFVQVASGFDVADNEIVARCSTGDLVITADIPLAADVIAKGCLALNPRGELYDQQNIGAKLNMRDFMDTMRASGIQTGGQNPLNQRDRQSFANQLDRYITQQR